MSKSVPQPILFSWGAKNGIAILKNSWGEGKEGRGGEGGGGIGWGEGGSQGRVRGPQHLKYLLSVLLQKKYASSYPRLTLNKQQKNLKLKYNKGRKQSNKKKNFI